MPVEQPALLPAEPVSISALRSGRRAADRGALELTAAEPAGSVVRRNQVEHVSDPLIPAAEVADASETTAETPDRRRGRGASTARALKRAAGSLDELLQQLDAVDTEVGRAHAEIEQVNRRIAELERRRQALGDQLALTLRSRVPAEILRLAAAEAVKSVPGEAGGEQAG